MEAPSLVWSMEAPSLALRVLPGTGTRYRAGKRLRGSLQTRALHTLVTALHGFRESVLVSACV